MYFLAINKAKEGADGETFRKTIGSHIQWTKNMIAAGKIVQAGKWGSSGGMAILRASNIAEAEKIVNEDPIVISGLVTFEVESFHPDVEIK